ncbi:MAG: hypothetical protein ACOCXZ_01700 [Chloroflexota bacterium]
MKRLTLMMLTLMTALGLLGGTVLAAPAEQGIPKAELTALSAYAPADAALFAAIRLDDGYLDTLDALLMRAATGLGVPPSELEGASMRDVLRDIANTEFDADYDEVRQWLGDTLAVYVPSLEAAIMGGSPNPFVLAAAVSDQAGAVGYFEDEFAPLIDIGAYTLEQTDNDVVMFQPATRTNPTIIVTPDALLIGTLSSSMSEVVLPGADAADLADAALFTDALNALPGADYNILAYVNPTNIIQLVTAFLPALIPDLQLEIDGETLAADIGQIAIGAVIVDERALLLDLATTGTAFTSGSTPVDLALLDRVPADTALLIQGTNLGGIVLGMVDALRLLDEVVVAVDPTAFRDVPEPIRFSSLATFVELSFEGTYGLDFQETMDALSGDFVNYVTANTVMEPASLQLGSNLLLTNDNPELVSALIEEMAAQAQETFNPSTFEDGVLTVPFGALFSLPDLLALQVASSDDVVVVGSPQDVAFALAPAGDALTSSATYVYEAAFFLPETTTLWYVDMTPVRAVLDAINEGMIEVDPQMRRDLMDLRMLAGLLDTASITAADTDGGFAIRATLTLAE